MSNKNEKENCEMCGGAMQTKRITRTYGKGANLLLIENVPVIVCSKCGETFLTAETLHEIARIKLHRKSFAKPREVAVAEFV
jgi:YgiT-type zinc finger domain-containing protein